MKNLISIIAICLFTFLYFYFRDKNEFKDNFEIRADWLETHGCACYEKITDIIQRTPNHSFIRHKLISDTSFVILWGRDSEMLRPMKDTVYCHWKADQVPSLVDEDSDFLVLNNRCGSNCSELHILPLNDTMSYQSFAYVENYDLQKHIVVYWDYDSIINAALTIQNFVTGKQVLQELK